MLSTQQEKLFTKMARRLNEPQSFLLFSQQKNNYGVMVKRNKWSKPVIRLNTDTIELFIKQDLLTASQKRKGFYVLSEAGVKRYYRLNKPGGYLAQHQHMEINVTGEMVNISGSPVSWLRRHNGQGSIMFSEGELAAAERLCADYEVSQSFQRLTVDLSRPLIGKRLPRSGQSLPDRVIDASRRVEKALTYVGDDLGEILKLICFEMLGLEKAEKKLGWPRRSGKLVLKISLRRLKRFYGI